MQIVKTALYEKQKSKLISRGSLNEAQINETENVFEVNHEDKRLRPHKITCKKDKRRRSITVPSTQFRILYTANNALAIFQQILSHDDYDRINKDC